VEVMKPLPYTASVMFHRDLIVPRLKGTTKEEVIQELIEKGKDRILDSEKVDRALAQSEDVVSTPIRKNIAFFHAFGDFVDDIVPIIGISAEGVEMKIEGIERIHVAFMFLAPEYLGEIYNKMVQSLSRIFSRLEHFEWLLRCETPDQIIAFISYLEAKNKIMKMLNIEDLTRVPL
jgi:mannitol/fructose-specific phosphotransferase system IIA component (Ntr-type)